MLYHIKIFLRNLRRGGFYSADQYWRISRWYGCCRFIPCVDTPRVVV